MLSPHTGLTQGGQGPRTKRNSTEQACTASRLSWMIMETRPPGRRRARVAPSRASISGAAGSPRPPARRSTSEIETHRTQGGRRLSSSGIRACASKHRAQLVDGRRFGGPSSFRRRRAETRWRGRVLWSAHRDEGRPWSFAQLERPGFYNSVPGQERHR